MDHLGRRPRHGAAAPVADVVAGPVARGGPEDRAPPVAARRERAGPRLRAGPRGARHRVLEDRRVPHRHPQGGGRRRASTRGGHPRPVHVRGDAAGVLAGAGPPRRHGPGHGSSGRSASPTSAASPASCSSGWTTRSSPSPTSRPTTTGWSRSGPARAAADSSPVPRAPVGPRSSPPPRSAATPRGGCAPSAFTELPAMLGLPSIHDADGHWLPFIQACDDTGTVICIHIGSSSTVPSTGNDAPGRIRQATINFNAQLSFVDWMFSGLLIRYPNLKLAFSESQIGWMPYALERMDRIWRMGNAIAKIDEIFVEPPSHQMAGRVFGCFFEDDFGIEVRDPSASTRSRSSPTTRTRTRPGPTPTSTCRRRWPACPPTRRTRSPGATPSGCSASSRSSPAVAREEPDARRHREERRDRRRHRCGPPSR